MRKDRHEHVKLGRAPSKCMTHPLYVWQLHPQVPAAQAPQPKCTPASAPSAPMMGPSQFRFDTTPPVAAPTTSWMDTHVATLRSMIAGATDPAAKVPLQAACDAMSMAASFAKAVEAHVDACEARLAWHFTQLMDQQRRTHKQMLLQTKTVYEGLLEQQRQMCEPLLMARTQQERKNTTTFTDSTRQATRQPSSNHHADDGHDDDDDDTSYSDSVVSSVCDDMQTNRCDATGTLSSV